MAEALHSFWESFDLARLQKDLDVDAGDIAARRAESELSRKVGVRREPLVAITKSPTLLKVVPSRVQRPSWKRRENFGEQSQRTPARCVVANLRSHVQWQCFCRALGPLSLSLLSIP